MSILVEIAERADVSVEGVVRVLTREPVSDAVKERVLAVLDDLDPEQTRTVQRFALAALHDVLGRPAAAVTQVAAKVEHVLEEQTRAPNASPDAALVELGSVLGELAEAVRDLRRETDLERRERVDDLAVLIDLITTGWQGLDTRLGRLERQIGRLEQSRRPYVPAPPTPAPAVVMPPPVAPPAQRRRSRLPLAAGLTLAAAAVVTLAVLQLAAGGPDLTRVVEPRETQDATTPVTMPPTAPPTTAPARTTAPATTTAATRTTAPATTTARPPARTTTARGTTAPPPATTRPAATPPTTATSPAATGPSRPSGFEPTRNWAWAPVRSADYYSVQFSRDGKSLYRTTTTEPRLTLPSSVVFRPGSYRWVVLPGFGPRSESRYGPPVVDSGFSVS